MVVPFPLGVQPRDYPGDGSLPFRQTTMLSKCTIMARRQESFDRESPKLRVPLTNRSCIDPSISLRKTSSWFLAALSLGTYLRPQKNVFQVGNLCLGRGPTPSYLGTSSLHLWVSSKSSASLIRVFGLCVAPCYHL